jgi:sugar phosphate isomerase/epimerase
MKKFPIALQLYSVRDRMARDFEGTLAEVSALGYDGVEFAGLYGKSAVEIKALCQKYNLTPISAHVPFVEMMNNPAGVLQTYAEIGCRYVVIPYLTEEYRPGNVRFDEVIAGAALLGKTAKELGMTLLYHNHDFEFKKIDGKYALDVLYDTVSPDLLQTELDLCWVKVGGEEPASYLRKYTGRAPVVHFKDFSGKIGGKMYALIGIEDDGEAASGFSFRPLGMGCQDISALLSAAEDAGAGWIVVEQDDPSDGLSTIECAKKSIECLKTYMK